MHSTITFSRVIIDHSARHKLRALWGNQVVPAALPFVLFVLSGCGQKPRDYEGLMKGLSSPDPVVRGNSASTLGRYYYGGTLDNAKGVPPTEEVVKLLMRNVDDTDTFARVMAVDALGFIGPKAKPAVPALIEQIKKTHEYRGGVLLALSYIGSEAKEAIPIILECMKDKDDATREYALAALANVEPNTERTIRILGEALSDESSRVRQRATRELGYQRPIPEPIVRALDLK